MKKAVKRTLFWIGGFFLLIIALLIIVPFFINLNHLKPIIEKEVSKMVNRPFKINGDIKLSLFPVATVAFSDLHLGNPPDYQEKDFVSIKAFDLRVKLLPLIKKEVQVKRFVVVEPQITLVKSQKGRANWEGMGKAVPETNAAPPPSKGTSPKNQAAGLPIKSLTVEEFSVKNAALFWIDHKQGIRKEIKELNLNCQEISFERPIRMTLSALIEKQPVAVQGSIGPLGKEPGKGAVPLDMIIKLFNELELKIKGKISDPMNQPQFDLTLETSHFSVKKLLETMGIALPVKTSQPEALTDLALSVKIKGNVKEIALSDGLFQLDQSKLRFKAGLSEFEKPRIDFDGKLDQFNADHYLPPAESKPAGPASEPAGNKEKIEKVNYAPLRKMILNAKLQIDSLTIHKVNLTDMLMKVTGKNGVFNIDPFNLKLYQGAIQSRTTLDVTREKPQTQAVMQVQGVEAGPLIRDLLQKDILEGKLDADLNLKADGDDLAAIRQSLNGNGNMVFKDGAIVGVDLSAMVQNIQAAFSGQAAAEKKPRTDFTEFKLPFTITNGLFETKGTSLASPFLRVQALGKANLVNEGLDFRVEPKIVTAIEGQGDQAKRKGITVPINVTGTFSNPKFTPDLSGMLKKGVEKIITDQLQGGDKKKKISVEDLLKGLFDE